MKYAIIIPDGAVGGVDAGLGNRTALEAARLPVLDELALCGRLGTTHTTTQGIYPNESGSHLSVIGYAPENCSAGAGLLTAQAMGVEVAPDEVVFCCDLVTVEDGTLRDLTAGGISTAEANPLVVALNSAFEADGFRFLAGRKNRCLCIWKSDVDPRAVETRSPAEILNEPVRRHMPPGSGSRPLYELMLRAQEVLSGHDVNLVRGDLGENTANAIWLWGQELLKTPTNFNERFGIDGVLLAESEVVRGIGRMIGWEPVGTGAEPETTDVQIKTIGNQAVAALDGHDLVCVQVESPFILSAGGHLEERIRALEQIDEMLAGPLVERLRCEKDWRLLVIPARQAPGACGERPVNWTMFMLAGSGIESNRGLAFDETNATLGEMHPERAHHLMEYFLRR